MRDDTLERDLGEQPLATIMAHHALKAGDLVQAAASPLTYKMVRRALRGRRLTPRMQLKIRDALNNATQGQYALQDLFNY